MKQDQHTGLALCWVRGCRRCCGSTICWYQVKSAALTICRKHVKRKQSNKAIIEDTLLNGRGKEMADRHRFLFFISVSFVTLTPSSFIPFFISGFFCLSLSSSSFLFCFIPFLIIVLSSQSDGSFKYCQHDCMAADEVCLV